MVGVTDRILTFCRTHFWSGESCTVFWWGLARQWILLSFHHWKSVKNGIEGTRAVPMIWRPLCKTLNGALFYNRNKQNLFLFHHLIASYFLGKPLFLWYSLKWNFHKRNYIFSNFEDTRKKYTMLFYKYILMIPSILPRKHATKKGIGKNCD
jgi:hypothetical protein